MEKIIRTASEELEIIKTHDIENLKEIATEILMLKGKLNIKRIWNNLDEFETKEFVAKLNAEIEILKEREKQEKKKIPEKLKLNLREMEAKETKFVCYILEELIKAMCIRYIKKSKIKSSLLKSKDT